MAIRFKFRSSLNFDSLAIGDQPSISVRDLKSKILRHHNLNICHDFDLVFSDALTGQEYIGEDFPIPNGSCVIIKRVPVGTTHTDMVQLVSFKDSQSQSIKIINSSPPVNLDMNELDDFGVDLYSVPGATTSSFYIDTDPINQDDKIHIDNQRFSEPSKGDCDKVRIERNASETNTKPKTEDFTNMKKVIKAISPSLQKINLLPELKCSICISFLKDAVMIRCCQHSFCERCIRLWLVEKGMCPKCYSPTSTAEDLLPNVSLRQAIAHFLGSYTLTTSSHCDILQYAPDGVSEVHARDVSYNVPTHQKETDLPHSSSPSETGSNEIMGETAHDLLFKENASLGCVASYFPHLDARPCERQILKERHASAFPEHMGGFNNNVGKCQRNNMEGGDKTLMVARRRRKVKTTCYMCGSPYHLIKACPAVSSSYSMQPTGIAMIPQPMPPSISTYRKATSFHPAGPFPNLYENNGVIPFKMALFPSAACAFPFMHSMYGSVPSFSGPMEMAGVASAVEANSDRQASGSEFLDFHNHDKSQKLSNYGFRSANSFDNDDCNKRPPHKQTENSYHRRSYLFRERSRSAIHERHPHRRKRKHRSRNLVDDEIVSVDGKNSHLELSSSEIEDSPCSSCCCSEERNKQHDRGFKREIKRDDLGVETDCVQGRQFYKIKRKRDALYTKSRPCKQFNHSESGLERSLPSDEKRQQKLTAHVSRFSKRRVKSVDNDLVHNRWQMRSGSDDKYKEDCRY